ncbi:MAG TPA: outer membrane protein assembly factor BamD [Blastocatellia bacterium]|nr:outer membrane protein assembly factor BamD [Blastocatellia bacterium]
MSGMKSFAKGVIFALTILFASVTAASAQGPASGPVEPARDQTKEMAAKHNLDVARYYLTKRKAYDGARDRLQEIIETYPDFSRMDEVVFLMGEAHAKLGKTETAVDYYNKLLKTYPDSELVKKARERLDKLKVEKKAGEEKL